MSGRLTNLQVGSLKTNKTRKTRTPQLPSLILQAEQVNQTQTISTIPELTILQQVPGIQPFLTRDLIPDLIYLLQYEGIRALIAVLPKQSDGKLASSTPITPEELLRVFQNQGWEPFLSTITTIINAPVADIISNIYTRGVQQLGVLVAQADPQNPSSIIFRHPSQEVHDKAQEVEFDMIRNEPEVAERDDIQCECGSRRIRPVPVQTRGADEPPTIFAHCVVCKRKWKFSAA
jgi:DNA-directed RNA polymerase subunit M/transcription elongation factor TFIIS